MFEWLVVEHMAVKLFNLCAFKISAENLDCAFGDMIFHPCGPNHYLYISGPAEKEWLLACFFNWFSLDVHCAAGDGDPTTETISNYMR